MDARIVHFKSLFGDQVSYQIPQFQRPYAWGKEDQWFPLWEDVRNLAERHLSVGGQGRVKPHFMGAIVLQHRQSKTGEVTKRIVVDGQQRLTTLQLLIKATQGAFEQLDDDARFNRLRELTENGESHIGEDPDNQTKIRQSNRNDQKAFQEAIRVTFIDSDGAYWPITKAFQYFKGKVDKWLAEAETPEEKVRRADALEEALAQHLLIAVIDLDDDEEPHIIFETLNARGETLRQSDLVKNTVMFEAGVVDDADRARQLWGMFEDQWWRENTSEARLDRIELDRLLNHWMMATTQKNVAYNRVASDFRAYLTDNLGENVGGENIGRIAGRIRSAGSVYRDALAFRDPDPPVRQALSRLIGDMNTVVVMPLILYLKAAEIPEARFRRCIQVLESYLVRRALYGRTTQGLTDFFVNLLERMHQKRPDHYEETMVAFFNSQTNDTLMWPNDRILCTNLTNRRLARMNVRRRKMVLVEIERHMREARMAEELGDTKNLTIEHIMPQKWQENWRLSSSSSQEARDRREEAVNFLGNLTLTTGRLNASLSNGPWEEKRTALENHSTLLLNWELLSSTSGEWNENAIEERSGVLASRIIDIWKPAQYFIDNPL